MKTVFTILAVAASSAIAGAPQDWRKLESIAMADGWTGYYEWDHSSVQWNTPTAKVWVRAKFVRRDTLPRFERALYALNCIGRTLDTLETSELGRNFGFSAKQLPRPARVNIPPDTVFDDLREAVCAERPETLTEFLNRVEPTQDGSKPNR